MKPKAPYLPQRRRLANRKPSFVPQARDFEIVAAVYDNRFLTTTLLAALFPPDHTRAPVAALTATGRLNGTPAAYPKNLVARLGKLFHHRYLDRLRMSYGGELIYAVGQSGAELLRDRQLRLFSDKIDWDEKNRALGQANIDHALMVSRFRVALVTALRPSPIVLDTFQREGKELKTEWRTGGRRAYVYPDAFFVLRDPGRPDGKNRLPCFLEADQSTMPHPRMVEKLERYAELASREQLLENHFGVSTFRVLTVTKTEARAKNLLATLRNARGVSESLQKLFFFISETEYAARPENVFSAVWYAGNNPTTPRPFHPFPPPAKQ